MSALLSGSRTLLLLSSLVVSLCACGRESKFYSDPGTLGVSNVVPITIEPTELPDGFFDQSVNDASVDVALDGVDPESVALRLRTLATSNPVGGFNGNGIANRAILGQARYAGKKLSEIGSITVDAKTYAGTDTVSILLLTDLNCDGSAIRVLIADASTLSPGTLTTAGYSQLDGSFDAPVWKVSGAAITDPAQPSTTLVPSSSSSSAASLTALLAKFPNACLRNASSQDPSLPKNLTTASILFALGSDTTPAHNAAFIRRISIGTDIYDYLQWGSK